MGAYGLPKMNRTGRARELFPMPNLQGIEIAFSLPEVQRERQIIRHRLGDSLCR